MRYTFSSTELNRIAELSKHKKFSLWFDKTTNCFYEDSDAPDTARYIYDVEQEETPEFIAEITNSILEVIDSLS